MEKKKPQRVRSRGEGHRIEDVARQAGVAPITVSRVLNNPASVAEPTRSRVHAAMEHMGYIPNLLAGGLASNKSNTIGVVLPYIDNPAFAERVQGMTDVLAPEGFNLLLGLSGYSPEVELQHVMAFLGQRVAALALTGNVHADQTRRLLEKAAVPVVEVPLISGPLIDMGVGYSNDGACYAMVEHLARCGYRKIALVTTPALNDQIVAQRRAGYLRAVAELGLVVDARLVVETKLGLAGGAAALVELLARHPDIDAVFCTSDLMAIGCLLEAMRRGIAVPGDIGIAGYDDIEAAREFVPALTTVRVQRYQMGGAAARLLLQRIRGETPARSTLDLGFEIVPRGSTRRARLPG